MKATGIVRRIDDLGRVVIPKEIRRTLRLREGTPLEIFTDREGEIILKKYSPMMELTEALVQKRAEQTSTQQQRDALAADLGQLQATLNGLNVLQEGLSNLSEELSGQAEMMKEMLSKFKISNE